MRTYLMLTILAISLLGCRQTKEVPLRSETVVRDRVVTIPVVQDSASIVTLLSWDPVGNKVIVSDYLEVKSENVETRFKVDSNRVQMTFKTMREDAKVIVRDSIVEREVPVYVEKEKKGGWWREWQRRLEFVGAVVLLSIFLVLILKTIKKI